jgi:uncharacterized protein YhjY with autotransporter beta-barrel domain
MPRGWVGTSRLGASDQRTVWLYASEIYTLSMQALASAQEYPFANDNTRWIHRRTAKLGFSQYRSNNVWRSTVVERMLLLLLHPQVLLQAKQPVKFRANTHFILQEL